MTGYKIFDRYKTRWKPSPIVAPARRYANQLPQQIESLIVPQARQTALGARKIRELLVRRLACDVKVPAKSTIHAVLDRHGLVKRSGETRHRAQRHATVAKAPRPTICGAPTSRVSSSSATDDTAIR